MENFFPVALIRFTAKVFLGSISLLTITGNSKNRAIHDSIAGSVVIVAKISESLFHTFQYPGP
jgi:uncharacterized RDD family membrane protein YckC